MDKMEKFKAHLEPLLQELAGRCKAEGVAMFAHFELPVNNGLGLALLVPANNEGVPKIFAGYTGIFQERVELNDATTMVAEYEARTGEKSKIPPGALVVYDNDVKPAVAILAAACQGAGFSMLCAVAPGAIDGAKEAPMFVNNGLDRDGAMPEVFVRAMSLLTGMNANASDAHLSALVATRH